MSYSKGQEIQSQIAWHMKKYKNLNSHWKTKSIDVKDKMIQMLELSQKDLNTLETKVKIESFHKKKIQYIK